MKKLLFILVIISVLAISAYQWGSVYLLKWQHPVEIYVHYNDEATKANRESGHLPIWMPKDAEDIRLQHCFEKNYCWWLSFKTKKGDELLKHLGFEENHAIKKPENLMQYHPFESVLQLLNQANTTAKYYQGKPFFKHQKEHLLRIDNDQFLYWIE